MLRNCRVTQEKSANKGGRKEGRRDSSRYHVVSQSVSQSAGQSALHLSPVRTRTREKHLDGHHHSRTDYRIRLGNASANTVSSPHFDSERRCMERATPPCTSSHCQNVCYAACALEFASLCQLLSYLNNDTKERNALLLQRRSSDSPLQVSRCRCARASVRCLCKALLEWRICLQSVGGGRAVSGHSSRMSSKFSTLST